MNAVENGTSFCPKCRSIWADQTTTRTNWTKREWTTSALSHSSPCKLCRTLRTMFERTPGHASYAYGVAKGTIDVVRCERTTSSYLSLSLEFTDDWNLRKTLDCAYKLLPVRRFAGRNPGADGYYDPAWILDSLNECDTKHKCHPGQVYQKQNVDFLVIDVYDSCILRAPAACRYVALSYVWGEVAQLQLTKDNIHFLKRKGALSTTNTPQTFQDALQICRDLYVRYLWIDQLCIFQDSIGHGNSQVAHMHNIYSGAYFTIIAATASDSASGIFPGKPRFNPPQSISISGTKYVVTPCSLKPLEDTLYSSKWNLRAWTMQEFVLSRRCLIFTENDCLLYCGSGAYIQSLDGTLLQPRNTYPSALLDHRLAFYKGVGLKHRRYARLVSLYGTRHLSLPKDILRAFAGISGILSPFFGGFHWGLPLTALRWALCWMHSDSVTRRPGFPSWTWAGWYHSSRDAHTAFQSNQPNVVRVSTEDQSSTSTTWTRCIIAVLVGMFCHILAVLELQSPSWLSRLERDMTTDQSPELRNCLPEHEKQETAALPMIRSVLSFPQDFDPDTFWPPSSMYRWTSATSFQKWPSNIVSTETRSTDSCPYLKSGLCPLETRHWIWDTDIGTRTAASDGYQAIFGAPMPSFEDIQDLRWSHILTFRSCVAVLAAQPSKGPLRKTSSFPSLSSLESVDIELPLDPEKTDPGTEPVALQFYLFYALLHHGSGFCAIILPVHINPLVRKNPEETEQVLATRTGNPIRVKADMWFRHTRNCIVHLR